MLRYTCCTKCSVQSAAKMRNLNNSYFNRFFSVREFIHSDTADRLGIENVPDEVRLANLSILANSLLLQPRMQMGVPFTITSGYRCQALNKAVGGVPSSYHIEGKACDIVFPTKDLMRLAAKLIVREPLCDLVLLENAKSTHPWLHIQWSYTPRHSYKVVDIV